MTDLHTRTFCIASWPSESAGQRQAHPWAERQREPAYTAVVRARKFRRLRIVKKARSPTWWPRLYHAKLGCRLFVKVCGCRPQLGGAAHTGAGVRKPPREEIAGGVVRSRVRRYGDFGAGGLLPE